MKKVANPQIESYKPKYPPHPVKTSIRLLLGWYSPPFRSPSIFTFNSTVLSVSSYKCFVKAVGLCILNLRDSLTVFPLSRTWIPGLQSEYFKHLTQISFQFSLHYGLLTSGISIMSLNCFVFNIWFQKPVKLTYVGISLIIFFPFSSLQAILEQLFLLLSESCITNFSSADDLFPFLSLSCSLKHVYPVLTGLNSSHKWVPLNPLILFCLWEVPEEGWPVLGE